MQHRLSIIGITLACAGAAGACDATKPQACTLIGCADAFTASVQGVDGSFPAGAHRIEVLADGKTLKCAFTFPLAIDAGGGGVQPACDAGLMVTVVNFNEAVTVLGTPGQVHVWQYVDDAAVLDAAVAPQYQDSRPNGPDCLPVCHQASAAWTLD